MPPRPDPRPASLTLRWPCTLVRAVGFDPTQEIETPELRPLAPAPGPVPLDPGWLAFLPAAGDPATADRAVAWAEHRLSKENGQFRVLILPGRVDLSADQIYRCVDPLQEDLVAQDPVSDSAQILLTTRVALGLERPRTTSRSIEYRGPSGRSVALTSLQPERLDHRPWRNPELLGRTTPWVERPELTRRLRPLLEQSTCRISGPLGTGKSRLVHEGMGTATVPEPYVRTSIVPRPDSQPVPLTVRLGEQLTSAGIDAELATTLEAQPVLGRAAARLAQGGRAEAATVVELLTRLGELVESPPRLIVDDVETLPESDWSLLEELTVEAQRHDGFRLLIVGRPRTEGISLDQVPMLRVPACSDRETEALLDQLGAELSLPETVRARILAWVGGNPLALECTLASLVHSRQITRVYGSFVYTGHEEVALESAARWRRHVLAEALRTGHLVELLTLTAAERPVPASELRSATALTGASSEQGWEHAARGLGLLRMADSPWGEAVELTSAAIRDALASVLDRSFAERLRHQLGELLVPLAKAPAGRRAAWQLVAGTTTGAEVACDLARSRAAELEPDEVIQILIAEIEALRRRGGDEEQEFELLWQLLRQPTLEAEVARKELHRAMQLGGASLRRRLGISLLRADRAQRSGDLDEAGAALRSALEATEDRTKLQIRILLRWGRLELRRERFQSARHHFERLLAVLPAQATSAADECRYQLGNLLLHGGKPEEALALHRQVLEHRTDGDDRGEPREIAASLCAIGATRLAIGDHPAAIDAHRKALELLGAAAPSEDRAIALRGLGQSLGRVGDFTAAGEALNESIELFRRRSDRVGEAVSGLARAAIRLGLDQLEIAEREVLSASFQLRLAGVHGLTANAEQLMGRIQLRRRSAEAAAFHLERALRIHRRLGDAPGESMDLALLVEEAMARGSEEDTRRRAELLERRLDTDRPQDLKQRLDFQLYRAWRWLESRGVPDGDPQLPLARAYTELMRQAGQLPTESRHRFLQQIPLHAAIVEAAAHLP